MRVLDLGNAKTGKRKTGGKFRFLAIGPWKIDKCGNNLKSMDFNHFIIFLFNHFKNYLVHQCIPNKEHAI